MTKRLLVLLLALLAAAPARTVRGADRERARRAFGRCLGDQAGRAVLGRAAPDHPAEVAHLLEEPRRLRPADGDHLEAARGRQGRTHRLAAAASLRSQRRHQLRLQGRGHPAGAHHAAGQRLGQLQACRRGQLAGVRGRLHPRGRQVRAHPAGDGDRRARATRHPRDLRQGAPAAADAKPVAGALRRCQVGRSDADRRSQGPEGRHHPRRLFLPGRLGPGRQHGQADGQHRRRGHPHPAEARRCQGCPARRPFGHAGADREDGRRRGEAGLRRHGQARSRLRAGPVAGRSRGRRAAVAGRGAAVRVAGRPDPEPDALRVPGAGHEGRGLRAAGRPREERHAARRRGLHRWACWSPSPSWPRSSSPSAPASAT